MCCPFCLSGSLAAASFHSLPICPSLAILRDRRRQLGAPEGTFERSSVRPQVVWLLGTSCCLTVGGGAGRARTFNELLPMHVALNSWQRPEVAGLPRWLFCPAAPGQTPWLVPGVDSSPGNCALLFREALAHVVDLNSFLLRLSLPGLGCSHQPGPGLHHCSRLLLQEYSQAWGSAGWEWAGCRMGGRMAEEGLT